MASRMRGILLLGTMITVALLKGPATAVGAEPVPFATASAPCSSGVLTFPVQASSHPSVIYRFRSVGATGGMGSEGGIGTVFAPGDSGWGIFDTRWSVDTGATADGGVEAGTAPKMYANCPESEAGSVEASLADRPSTPATFSGVTSRRQGSFLPFVAPGTGQYALDLTMTQGAVEIQGVPGILQSSGTYSLGDLAGGPHNLRVDAVAGPSAIWSATVRKVPVAINGLSFGRGCMAPATGIPARFSVTGDTSIAAAIRNSSGGIVRDLGSFPVRHGKGSIPWDGRNAAGGPVANGRYVLALTSTDPQGQVTSARTGITVASSAPRVKAATPRRISPRRALVLRIFNDPCGVSSVKVQIDGQLRGVYRRGAVVAGKIQVPPRGSWAFGKHRWRVVSTDPVGNRRISTGIFKVKRASKRAHR